MVLPFFCCLFLGAICRLWFFAFFKLIPRIGRPAVIAVEFVSMGAIAACFAAIIFFLSGGVFMPYMAIAAACGFMLAYLFT